MNDFEQNPDEFWRSVFDDAAETPPPRVWDAIERQLDEPDAAGIVPLWATGFLSKQSVSWGMAVAATVALLLVGRWLGQSPESRQPVASHRAKSAVTAPDQQDAIALNQSSRQSLSSVASGRSNQQRRSDGSSAKTSPASARVPTLDNPVLTPEYLVQQSRSASFRSAQTDKLHQDKSAYNQPSEQLAITGPPASSSPSALLSSSAAQPMTAQSLVANSADLSAQSAFFAQKLDPLPMKLRSAGQIHRIVWVRPYEAPQQPLLAESRQSSRSHWVSLNVMPNAFNPAVSVQAKQPALVSAYRFNIANSSQPSVKSRADLSMAYQANAGVQLNDHWSVESGIGYLAGHATIDSPSEPFPVSMLSALNSSGISVNTLYTEVLRQSVQRNAPTVDKAASINWDASSVYSSLYAYDPQTRQTLTNDYQFVQVPVQVGYQLRPRKRLGLALLGGFLTNIFLRNTVENQLVIKPEDGIYQPVTLAAAMGARFQYRSSQRWSASLAGMYQPTLGSATKSGSSVQSHPTTTGMSFGVDYHF